MLYKQALRKNYVTQAGVEKKNENQSYRKLKQRVLYIDVKDKGTHKQRNM